MKSYLEDFASSEKIWSSIKYGYILLVGLVVSRFPVVPAVRFIGFPYSYKGFVNAECFFSFLTRARLVGGG